MALGGHKNGKSAWPRGGGEIGERIRAYDWSRNPLGPVAGWHRSFRAIVEFTLASPQPTKLLWGPELIQLYNDAFAAIIGDKHPAGLGQRAAECWAEIAELSAPIYARVLGGETLTMHNRDWKIARRGMEDVSFTSHLTPLRGDDGAIAGIHAVIDETTDKLRETRKVALLSPRERSVLSLLTAGHPNKAIAAELGISVRTVELHRANMMRRLGVKHVADAVRLAVTAQSVGSWEFKEPRGRRPASIAVTH